MHFLGVDTTINLRFHYGECNVKVNHSSRALVNGTEAHGECLGQRLLNEMTKFDIIMCVNFRSSDKAKETEIFGLVGIPLG